MKKLSLMMAAAIAVAMLMTGCFGNVMPAPTQAPTMMPTATVMPTATAEPIPTDAPAATDVVPTVLPEATEGLKVAPSPSASTAP